MGSQTTGNVGGDLIVSQLEPIVNCESREYTNAGEELEVFPVGYPWTYDATTATPVDAADIANVTALTYQEHRVEAGETVQLPLLVRGPVAINKDVLPEEDIAEDAIDAGDFVDALAALGFTIRQESETQEEQTT